MVHNANGFIRSLRHHVVVVVNIIISKLKRWRRQRRQWKRRQKMNLRPFKDNLVNLDPLNLSNIGDFSWTWTLKDYPASKRERKIHPRMFLDRSGLLQDYSSDVLKRSIIPSLLIIFFIVTSLLPLLWQYYRLTVTPWHGYFSSTAIRSVYFFSCKVLIGSFVRSLPRLKFNNLRFCDYFEFDWFNFLVFSL